MPEGPSVFDVIRGILSLLAAVWAAGLVYSYIARDFPVYTRLSEYEPDPAFMDSACGIWVDNFSGEFPQVSKAKHYLDAGYRVALVSPELHGRAPDALWQELLEAGLHHHPLFELCTDFPVRASDLLGRK